ncbi:MAG TPA: ATP-dependent DNA helicase [Methanoregulaceae archaeon]|nr:ATP-dependent DNA helicase [Methanoregulaceae archaeon]
MLTPDQERAVASDGRHLVLIACAGSGKTETITRRIARLVSGGVPPSSIVAFTFTERAAAEMGARVRVFLRELPGGGGELGGLYVGTIHAYCLQRLREIDPVYRSYDLLDENARPIFCRKYYRELDLDGLRALYPRTGQVPTPYTLIHDFCRNADLVRDERIDVTHLEEPFAGCYLAYSGLLHEHRYLDFAGIIGAYVEALEGSPTLLAREQGRVRHLVVDEYQDINTLQERLIELMVGKDGNLCVVGDDDQCIYHWRGSDVEKIIRFRDRYPDATVFRIQENFRSTPAVIDTASRVIRRNSRRLSKTMRPWSARQGGSDEGEIAACFFATEQEEVRAIVTRARRLRGQPYTDSRGRVRHLGYGDMAVLMRSVRHRAVPLLDAFDRAGIPCLVRGGVPFARPEVDLVMHALAFIGEVPYPHRSLEPVSPLRLGELQARLEPHIVSRDAFLDRMRMLRHEMVRSGKAFSLQRLFHRILREMGGDRIRFPAVWYHNLGTLSQLITAFEHQFPAITPLEIQRFIEFVGEDARHRTIGDGDVVTGIPDAVTVTTIHRAKGLQYPVVFIPGLIEGAFPSGRQDDSVWFVPPRLFDRRRYETGLEEERRLFYVGITRSEKYLYLSGHRRPSGDSNPAEPSIFLEEVAGRGVRSHFAGTDPVPGAVPGTESGVPVNRPSHPVPLGTSWSALRYYARCPEDYRLRFVCGFDPAPKEELGLGRAVHAVLAALHGMGKYGSVDPGAVSGLVDQYLHLRFAEPDALRRMREFVVRQTVRYIEQASADLARIRAFEQGFSLPVGDSVISGAIDLVLSQGDGVEIREIKLSGMVDREHAFEWERQLQVYALAARSLGMEVRSAAVRCFDTGALHEVPVDPVALQQTHDALERMIEGIRRGEFPPAPEEGRCRGCDWRCICSAHSAANDPCVGSAPVVTAAGPTVAARTGTGMRDDRASPA